MWNYNNIHNLNIWSRSLEVISDEEGIDSTVPNQEGSNLEYKRIKGKQHLNYSI